VNPQVFFASVQLNLLSSALDLASRCVATELAAIDSSLEDGSAPEDFDWEAAQDSPIALSRLTSRAVVYELVATVEYRLHELAGEPWLKKRTSAREASSTISSLADPFEAWASLKDVSEEAFPVICKLIDQHFNFHLADLEGWSELVALRAIVNSLKHGKFGRNTKKRYRKDEYIKFLFETDLVDEEKTRKAIADITRFLLALEQAVECNVDTT
jgi:hypothetical protein